MADHLRTQIRRAVFEALQGLEDTGPNVFLSRRHPLQAEHLPALCIYTLNESSEPETMGPTRRLRRELTLAVECVAEHNDDLDDALDRMALQVETALAEDVTLGGLAYVAVLTATAVTLHPTREGELETGSASLSFRITYRALHSDPSSN